MIPLFALILSPLVFLPGLLDGYTGPKLFFVISVGIWICATSFKRGNPPKILYPLFGLLALSIASYFWITNFYAWIFAVAIDTVSLLAFWEATALLDNGKKIDKAILVFVLVASVMAIYGMLSGSLGSTMKNPGYAALHLAAAVPLGAYLILQSKNYKTMVFFSFLIALIGFILFQLPNRLAVPSVAIGLFLFYLLQDRVWALAVGVSVVILLWFYASILSSRLPTWQNAAMAYHVDSPIVGFGRGQFAVIYPKYANRVVRDRQFDIHQVGKEGFASRTTVAHAHNDFLELLFELGAVGPLLFGYFLFLLVSGAQNWDMRSICLFSSLGVFFVYMMFWFVLELPSQSVWFFILAGMFYKASRNGLRD
jgi:hypothetical protein